MDIKVAEEFLDELFSSLETLETQSAAVLQFLKAEDKITDEELAPYMEQASKASNVRWRATRLRLMSLFSSAVKGVEPSEKSLKSEQSAEQSEDTKKVSEPEMKQAATRPSEQQKSETKTETSETPKPAEGRPEAAGQATSHRAQQEAEGGGRDREDAQAAPQSEKKDAA